MTVEDLREILKSLPRTAVVWVPCADGVGCLHHVLDVRYDKGCAVVDVDADGWVAVDDPFTAAPTVKGVH